MRRDDERQKQGTLFDVLFSIAVWLTCTFSTWATYIGFSVDFPKPIAAVIALAIGLFLVALNFELRKRRRAAEGLAGPLAMLGVVVVFSFLGNTNAIYSYSIRRDIVGQTQEEAWRVFDSETSKILAAIKTFRLSSPWQTSSGASRSHGRISAPRSSIVEIRASASLPKSTTPRS